MGFWYIRNILPKLLNENVWQKTTLKSCAGPLFAFLVPWRRVCLNDKTFSISSLFEGTSTVSDWSGSVHTCTSLSEIPSPFPLTFVTNSSFSNSGTVPLCSNGLGSNGLGSKSLSDCNVCFIWRPYTCFWNSMASLRLRGLVQRFSPLAWVREVILQYLSQE